MFVVRMRTSNNKNKKQNYRKLNKIQSNKLLVHYVFRLMNTAPRLKLMLAQLVKLLRAPNTYYFGLFWTSIQFNKHLAICSSCGLDFSLLLQEPHLFRYISICFDEMLVSLDICALQPCLSRLSLSFLLVNRTMTACLTFWSFVGLVRYQSISV